MSLISLSLCMKLPWELYDGSAEVMKKSILLTLGKELLYGPTHNHHRSK